MFKCLDGPGLSIPWQTDSMNDAFKDLTNQERNNITQEAQVNKNQNYFIFQFCV